MEFEIEQLFPSGRTEAVVFDIGNVLVRVDDEGYLDAVAPYLACDRREYFARTASDTIAYGSGRIDTASYYERLVRNTGLRLDRAAWERRFAGIFTPDHEMLGLAADVSRRADVYLLSNTCPLHDEALEERLGLSRLARGRVLSYREGLRKPNPAIYRLLMKRYALSAGACLFIDDDGGNVAAARGLGMGALRRAGVVTDANPTGSFFLRS